VHGVAHVKALENNACREGLATGSKTAGKQVTSQDVSTDTSDVTFELQIT